jgi:hypothetical protein
LIELEIELVLGLVKKSFLFHQNNFEFLLKELNLFVRRVKPIKNLVLIP